MLYGVSSSGVSSVGCFLSAVGKGKDVVCRLHKRDNKGYVSVEIFQKSLASTSDERGQVIMYEAHL